MLLSKLAQDESHTHLQPEEVLGLCEVRLSSAAHAHSLNCLGL